MAALECRDSFEARSLIQKELEIFQLIFFFSEQKISKYAVLE